MIVVPEKAQRCRFNAEYRLRIVEGADKCTKFGEVGEPLRRRVNQRGQASECAWYFDPTAQRSVPGTLTPTAQRSVPGTLTPRHSGVCLVL